MMATLTETLRASPVAFVAVFSLTLSGVASRASAASPADGGHVENLLEEIVVTATRRASSLQNVPFNIAAITSDSLERRRLVQLSDLSRNVPGLMVIDQGPRAASRMTARGLNVTSLNEAIVLFNSSGNTVATYLGEIPIYVDYRIRDLERVEFLLGPQGTMYGAGTLGGAIRYIPKQPETDNWTASITAAAIGQNESNVIGSDLRAVLNAPLVQDKLGLRLSVSQYDDPGFTDYSYLLKEPGVSNPQPDFDDAADVVDNLFSKKDADGGEVFNFRAALKWQVNEDVAAKLDYYVQDADYGGRSVNHRHAFGTGKYVAASRVEEPNHRENQLLSLEIVAALETIDLVSATGVSEFRELGQRDQTDLLLTAGFDFEDFENFVDIASDRTAEDRFSQEIRLVSRRSDQWSWIVGAFYSEYEFRHELNEFAPGYAGFLGTQRPDDLLFVLKLEEKQRESAVYGELSYAFNLDWQVTVGARHSDVKTKNGEGSDLPLILTALGFYEPDEVNVNVVSFEDDESETLFKVNTSYRFNDNLMAYGTISEGFRLGGINPAPRCPDPNPGLLPCLRPGETSFQADTTLNYEFGVRNSWQDGRINFSAAAYFIDWRDIQLDTLSEDLFLIKVNGGDATTWGTELMAQAKFSERLNGSFGYAFNKAELATAAPGAVDGEDAFSGDRLPGYPEHQFNASLTYSQPLGSNWNLSVDYSLTYTSDVYTKTGLRNNGEILSGYTVHNVAASFASAKNWTARLFVDNLFDEFAETNVRNDQSFVRDVGVHPLRLYYRNVLRPRQYGVELRYDFGLN